MEPWELILKELSELRAEVRALKEYLVTTKSGGNEVSQFHDGPVVSLTGDVFSKMIGVYEEERRRKNELNRKTASGRRVARKIAELTATEILRYLKWVVPGLSDLTVSCERILGDKTDPIHVTVRRGEEIRCVCRVFVDLGWAGRGSYFRRTIADMVDAYQQADVPSDRVLILVVTLVNSVETGYVEALLGEPIKSLQSFLDEPGFRLRLEEYVRKVKEHLVALPAPAEQVHILSPNQHPNGFQESGDEIRGVIIDPDYRWIDSFEGFLKQVEKRTVLTCKE